MKSIEEKRAEFRKLHQSGCFAIPNPWDIGTAKYLQHLGFKAIATTSAGFAFSCGLSDGSVKRDDMIAEAFRIIHDEVSHIPLHQQALVWGVSKKVHVVQRPDNLILFYWYKKD